MTRLLVLTCPLLLAALPALGGSAPPHQARAAEQAKADNYIIFPVTTELQRKEFFFGNAKYYVLVNATPAIVDRNTIRATALNLDKLKAALTNDLATDGAFENKTKFQASILYKTEVDEKVKSFFCHAIEGVAHVAFKNVEVVSQYSGDEWQSALSIVNEFGSPRSKIPEDGVGDALVKAYPVRTPLSRYSCPGDCVVVLSTRFDRDWNGKLSVAQERSIEASVRKLKLSRKDSVTFRIKYRGEGDNAVVEFETNMANMAKRLGFKHSLLTVFRGALAR
jgi:hypothetical protein